MERESAEPRKARPAFGGVRPNNLSLPAYVDSVWVALFHFGFVLLLLLFVVAFEDFVAVKFVEGAVFVQEEDVCDVVYGIDWYKVIAKSLMK